MSIYQIGIICVMSIIVVAFVISFRMYVVALNKRESTERPASNYDTRRRSSLAANSDVDSEIALERPIAVNEEILRVRMYKER